MIQARTAVIAAGAVLMLIGSITGCDSTSRNRTTTTPQAPTATTPQAPPKLNGHQEYKSAQQLADDLNARGHRCDMSHDTRNEYVTDAGRCYLGGSSGPEIVLAVYASRSRIDDYFAWIIPKSDTYAWLVGNKWTINCATRAVCSELQPDMGGSITASANQPPPTSTTPPAPMSADQEIAAAAQRYLLEQAMQPPDGSFKNVECIDSAGNTVEPDRSNPDCWESYINSISFSGGVLYLHMDADWRRPPDGQPDGALMVRAQNSAASLLRLGPGPKIVMDNVRTVQSMDRNGETRSDAPLSG